MSRAGCGALGVADGVGGWAAEGVDPAAYALKLMERCGAALEGPYPCRSALAALEYAQVGGRPAVRVHLEGPVRRLRDN